MIARQLEDGERVAARAAMQAVHDLLGETRAAQERPGRVAVQPLQPVDGHVGPVQQRGLALAGREHDPDRVSDQAADGEQQGVPGGPVQPLRVIDHHQERGLVGAGRQQGQRRCPDREAVELARRSQRERALQGLALRRRDVVQVVQCRPQQLEERRERDPGLRLDAPRAQHAHPGGPGGRVLQQRRLPDAHLPDQREHGALSRPDVVEQAVEEALLLSAAHQHSACSLGRLGGSPEAKRSPRPHARLLQPHRPQETHDPDSSSYTLPPEQAVALTDESSPAFLPGFFQIALGSVIDSPRITEAARTGAGVGWHDHVNDVHEGCERFFRPGYDAHLIAEWLPALEGVVAKLERGARVADVGCGHGASTILMAHSFPASTFVGSDAHDGSIATARERAIAAGVTDRVRFETAPAADYAGDGYDLVTLFDCLHDMGDPVGAARHIRGALAPDGTLMIVEPAAGDRVEDNLNPVGRAYYGFSTLLCTPSSLSQEVGLALGAQAGEARIREVVTSAGFSRFRRVAETPFNLVYEARP